jgi:hypothetical protein
MSPKPQFHLSPDTPAIPAPRDRALASTAAIHGSRRSRIRKWQAAGNSPPFSNHQRAQSSVFGLKVRQASGSPGSTETAGLDEVDSPQAALRRARFARCLHRGEQKVLQGRVGRNGRRHSSQAR